MKQNNASLDADGHRWFAAMYDFIGRFSERGVMRAYRKSIAGAAAGQVLEIGAGTGFNFPYYAAAVSIVATDPNPFMLRRAREKAQKLGLKVEFHQYPAEMLPFPDASFDTVISTLTLCTVQNPAQALSEVKRVLKSGGTFRFIEHVQSEHGFHKWVQNMLTPFWRWPGAGCHLNRGTANSIEAAGLRIFELQRHHMPLVPLIIGTAKPRN